MHDPAIAMAAEPVLQTLLHPFAIGALRWPASGEVLFLRARAEVDFPRELRGRLRCRQSFKPHADALVAEGHALGQEGLEAGNGDAVFPLVLVLPPRQREEARALMANALRRADEGALVVACMGNDEGARSGEADFRRLAGPVQALAKHHCRVFWARKETAALDVGLMEEWSRLDAPRRIADGRFLSRPGLFAWDRIDVASKLLAENLPDDLSGAGADLGAGYGYLSAELLAHCPGISSLDLYEAEARALELAKENLRGVAHPATRDFLWHDVATGLPRRYDIIVSNPPFHQGREDLPQLGRAFIAAAAAALRPDGRLLLVANRHLPYESALREGFARVVVLAEAQGFKVIEARKASP
jgi:16S rRNA (guanine1207-N2)-methyltransferase